MASDHSLAIRESRAEPAERRRQLAPPDFRPRIQIFAHPHDSDLAERIAQALGASGYEVIGGELDLHAICAALVIWSQASVDDAGVVAAARAALAVGALTPVMRGDAVPPTEFASVAATPLSRWRGESDDPRWRFVLDDLADIAAVRSKPPRAARVEPDQPAAVEANLAAPYRRGPESLRKRTIDPATLLYAAAAVILGVFAALAARVSEGAGAIREARLAQSAIETVNPPVSVGPRLSPPVPALVAATPAAPERPAPELARAAPTPPAPTPAEQPLAAPVQIETPRVAPAPRLKPAPRKTVAAQATHTDEDAIAILIAQTAPARGDDYSPSQSGGARERLRDCAFCPELVAIEAGRALIGAPAGSDRAGGTESPQLPIEIAKPFALGVREVTFAEWDACVADGGCGAYRPDDSGWGRGGRPVINVSWRDAQDYVRWLTKATGAPYRLPSEAEWEYAAQIGRADSSATRTGGSRTAPAGAGPVDAAGLQDMAGNVWEWTQDCWVASRKGGPTDGSAREGACRSRVMKGGAWNTGAWRLRPAHRIGKPDSMRDYDAGFRVARDL